MMNPCPNSNEYMNLAQCISHLKPSHWLYLGEEGFNCSVRYFDKSFTGWVLPANARVTLHHFALQNYAKFATNKQPKVLSNSIQLYKFDYLPEAGWCPS